MLAKITHKRRDHREAEPEYVQGSPASVGVKIGDILLSPHPNYPNRDDWPVEKITIEVLPELENLGCAT